MGPVSVAVYAKYRRKCDAPYWETVCVAEGIRGTVVKREMLTGTENSGDRAMYPSPEPILGDPEEFTIRKFYSPIELPWRLIGNDGAIKVGPSLDIIIVQLQHRLGVLRTEPP